MHRMLLAIRVFFQILFSAEVAQRVEEALGGVAISEVPREEPPPRIEEPVRPLRSEALTLLAALQREARFVDFIQEPLDDYSDAQVGAVARDVHRDCGKVVERMLALRPVLPDSENSTIEVPDGFDPGRYRLTGNISGNPPFRGQLVHHGWEATHCELPEWSGTSDAARVVAPAEVELK